MNVIKRNGTEVIFDLAKIIAAITKANDSVEESARMTPMQIQRIVEFVELSCLKMNRSPSVEEIQDWWSTRSWPTGHTRLLQRLPIES